MNEKTDFLTEIAYPDSIKRSTVGKTPAKQPDNITKGAYTFDVGAVAVPEAEKR